MTISTINSLSSEQLRNEFTKCCGASNWVDAMIRKRPFQSKQHLFELAEKVWYEDCDEKDWLEAFRHHPKIGDLKSLEKKFASTKNWASNEQSGVNSASNQLLHELADLNHRYENKFGYIFIVCASGKSAEEMLSILKSRINNHAEEELKVAMSEQCMIAKLRLEKLLTDFT